MDGIKTLIRKYKDVIAYLFFGFCTTLVNFLAYWLFYEALGASNVASNVVAWILAVAFAYVTNKLWVFGSKSFDISPLKREIPSFISARLLTGLLDLAIMYVAVDALNQNAALWKLISNCIVILLNYIASKLFIFKK